MDGQIIPKDLISMRPRHFGARIEGIINEIVQHGVIGSAQSLFVSFFLDCAFSIFRKPNHPASHSRT